MFFGQFVAHFFPHSIFVQWILRLAADSGLDGFDLSRGANVEQFCRAQNLMNVTANTLNSFPDYFNGEKSQPCRNEDTIENWMPG